MELKPLRKDLQVYLKTHHLTKKWQKIETLVDRNIRHPSLHVELLEPRWRGIYSLRIDRQYRALFFLKKGKVEVFQITNHYRK